MTPSFRLCLAVPLAALWVVPWIVVPWPIGSASAQGVLTPEAARSQLSAVLSLVSGGMIGSGDHAPQVTRDGDAWRVRVPLPELTTPTDAAVRAMAKPLAAGIWDITSLSLPPAGTIETAPRPGADHPGMVSFSIGRQAIHARVDPSLSVASPIAVALGNITLTTEGGGRRSEQAIARFSLDGTLSADANRRMTIQTNDTAANWRIGIQDNAGVTSNSLIRSAAASFGVEGLDPAQAARLRAAGGTLAAGGPHTGPGGRPGELGPARLTPYQRDQLRAMLDASVGLLTRLNVQETLQGVHFEGVGVNRGDIGRVSLGLTSEARGDRLSTQIDLALDDLTLRLVPADLAAYVPNRVDVKLNADGVRTTMLMRLLRDATAADADPAALRAEAITLLSDPETHVGVAHLSFQSGPLQVAGSSRLRPLPDGTAAIDIHVTARGADKLIAQGQDSPAVQQILPLVFLAKGLARAEGDGLVWDISIADGVTTVNGMPLGHLGGQMRRP
ncbi:hypothetical protein [Rhodopila sp.]|uniref:hypothetical protein n=1 Tax=Rhodopila sp. TaxID=2480087 RepID=UPI003D14E0FB